MTESLGKACWPERLLSPVPPRNCSLAPWNAGWNDWSHCHGYTLVKMNKISLNQRSLLTGLIVTESISETFIKTVHWICKRLTYPRNYKIMMAIMLLFDIMQPHDDVCLLPTSIIQQISIYAYWVRCGCMVLLRSTARWLQQIGQGHSFSKAHEFEI